MKVRGGIQSGFILFALAAAGCGGYSGPRDISNDDPAIKIPAIVRAVRENDRSQVPRLVDELDNADPAVRFYAIEALRRLSGEDFDYDWTEDDRLERQRMIRPWREYVQKQSAEARDE